MFRERISRQYPSLSPSFRKVADLILTSHQRAAFMSASRLAKYVGVDVATVTRFAQQLGYEGYVELSREIQESVLEEMRESRAPVLERLESAESPITQTLWRDWANLEKTIQNISVEDAQQAMQALRSARSIYIVSEGVGIGLAIAAQGYLKMLKPDVFVLGQGPFDMAMELKEMTPQDVVIGIGYTSYAYAATRALQFANGVGALTIGIIGQPDCPIATQARLLFGCSVTEKGYLPSPTCPGAILFAFVYNLFMGDPDTYNRKLVQFQELYANLTEGTARGDEEVVDDLLGFF